MQLRWDGSTTMLGQASCGEDLLVQICICMLRDASLMYDVYRPTEGQAYLQQGLDWQIAGR